jgi:hypothetical protein
METWTHGEWTWRHGIQILGNSEFLLQNNGKTEAGKWKMIFLICLTFAHRANEGLSFVRLLTKKQTEVIRLHNGINELNGINQCFASGSGRIRN